MVGWSPALAGSSQLGAAATYLVGADRDGTLP